MAKIKDVLETRGKIYGEFINNATIAQHLKEYAHGCGSWELLDYDQKEAIDNICIKMSRILSPGTDKKYIDNWTDIAGYANLVSDRLIEEQQNEQ